MKQYFHKILMAAVGVCVLVGLDQYTKCLAITHLKEQADCVLISGIFRLTYVENFGAAFGMMQNGTALLLVMTGLLLAYLMLIYVNLLRKPGYRILRVLCLVIVAGGIGNIIDRAAYGFVVDFLYFELINFPVFNIADCYITCGAFAFVLSMFTVYKDDDMDFLIPFGKKKEKTA